MQYHRQPLLDLKVKVIDFDLKVKVIDLEFPCQSFRLKILGPHYIQTIWLILFMFC